MSNVSNGLPINKINEYKVKINAFLVFLTTTAFLLTQSVWLAALLVLDFGLRGFDLGKYSLFSRISDQVISTLNLGVKPVFYPPKRFAARIGLIMSVLIVALQVTGSQAALIFAGILVFFAALEAFAGFCAGCYAYNLLLPLLENSGKKPEQLEGTDR